MILAGILLAFSGGTVFAYTSGVYGSSTYGSCDYGEACSITITSNGAVSLNVVPTSGGSCTIRSDTVSVLTDDANGYTLTLADNTDVTALSDGPSTISATAGTLASPSALTGNSWGYRIDGVGSFGSGPTTAQTNVSPTSALFAEVQPNSEGGDTIADTSTAADPAQTTTVWFGACANTAVSSGTYTGQVVYTAVAN